MSDLKKAMDEASQEVASAAPWLKAIYELNDEIERGMAPMKTVRRVKMTSEGIVEGNEFHPFYHELHQVADGWIVTTDRCDYKTAGSSRFFGLWRNALAEWGTLGGKEELRPTKDDYLRFANNAKRRYDEILREFKLFKAAASGHQGARRQCCELIRQRELSHGD